MIIHHDCADVVNVMARLRAVRVCVSVCVCIATLCACVSVCVSVCTATHSHSSSLCEEVGQTVNLSAQRETECT